jgi:glycosyltransferase involved in cell wall biosynthesis
MNLLYFSQLFYPSVFGGGEYFFFLITKELAKKGHDVHVVTQRLKDTKKTEVYEGIKIHRVGSEFVFSGTLPPTFKHNLTFVVNSLKKGIEIIRDYKGRGDKIDVIHSNPYVPILAGHGCAKVFRIPHIASFYDVYQSTNKGFWKEWMSEDTKDAPFYAPFFAKLIERFVLKFNVYSFQTISEMSKLDLLNFGVKREKIALIPPGIEPPQLAEDRDLSCHYNSEAAAKESTNIYGLTSFSNNEEPSAVFVGRLIFYKNIDSVIRAFERVVQIIPNAKLFIVGDGPHKDKLKKEAEGLEDRIVFTGRIPQDEKFKIIRKSLFVVFPSLFEGFGIVTIEAFACGRPVLAAKVRPLSDIVKDGYTGYTVPPFDIDAWTEKMIFLFENRNKVKEMGENALRDFESNYQLDKLVSEMEKLYESAVCSKTNSLSSNTKKLCFSV